MTNMNTVAARNKRIKDLEARVAELEQEREDRARGDGYFLRLIELEKERDEARAKLTNADRLVEAVDHLKAAALRAKDEKVTVGCWHQVLVAVERADEALAAYEAGEPVVHPDTSGGCGAYIGGYCGDEGQLCGACVFDAAREGESGN